ncbi:uncharacterized protein YqgQ [Bacillus chungangensis]|uniref:Uncharacterized protein YqgQ n=2 Tax=Bacillus chungangensis TaxID=587633 RepID=A0ABT9WPX0_9BACI|nr:uncharacterized protein YqgQ [Bacillus chungangensis]
MTIMITIIQKDCLKGIAMKNFYDVQQLLKRYGIFIYIGKRLADIELMESEIRELYEAKLLEIETFQQAMLILRAERSKETNIIGEKKDG